MIKTSAVLYFVFCSVCAVGGGRELMAQDATAINQSGAASAASLHDDTAKPSEHYYKLVFKVIAVGEDGSSSGSRLYSQVVGAEGPSSRPSEIRTGDKIPMETGNPVGGVSTQYQYIDVGTEIDTTNVTDHDGALQAFITAKVSSVGKQNRQSTLPNVPVIRQCQWNSKVTVPIGKPTIIFSSDNPSDKGKTELELTATPIK